MSRLRATLASVLAIAMCAASCSLFQGPVAGAPPHHGGERFTAADGVWSIDIPSTAGAFAWIDEQAHDGETSVLFGTPYAREQWLVEVSPELDDALSIPAEAARVLLDQMQGSLAKKQASVRVLDEAESRAPGRGVVSRVWVEETPVKLSPWQTGIQRNVRVVQVEVREDRFVVFTLLFDDGRRSVERDHPLHFAEHSRRWRDFIDSFRFEETPASPSRGPAPP
jgi:hypothetical protein